MPPADTTTVDDRTASRITASRLGWLPDAQRLLPAVALPIIVAGLAAAQGGYFAPSWGWAFLAFLVVVEVWLIASGSLDASRLDWLFLGAMTAFVVWTTLSLTWTVNPAQTALEIQRCLTVLAGVSAFVILTRRTTFHATTVSLVVAITAVSGYGLATRLFPGRLGTFDPTSGYRLSEPIGYWNGLGIVSVIGILLAVGLVLTDRPVDRAIGGFAIVVLPVVLFYTYSRGSWLALAAGAFVLAAVSPRRLRLAGTASLLAGLPRSRSSPRRAHMASPTPTRRWRSRLATGGLWPLYSSRWRSWQRASLSQLAASRRGSPSPNARGARSESL